MVLKAPIKNVIILYIHSNLTPVCLWKKTKVIKFLETLIIKLFKYKITFLYLLYFFQNKFKSAFTPRQKSSHSTLELCECGWQVCIHFLLPHSELRMRALHSFVCKLSSPEFLPLLACVWLELFCCVFSRVRVSSLSPILTIFQLSYLKTKYTIGKLKELSFRNCFQNLNRTTGKPSNLSFSAPTLIRSHTRPAHCHK